MKEAQEEAGVEGELVGDPEGTYEYRKWGRRLKVAVYAMRVVRVLDRWPKAEVRDRGWFELEEASQVLPYDSHRRLLERAIERFRVFP